MTRARQVIHVAELVGLDARRRRVRTDTGAPATLGHKAVTKVRLCWQVGGEVNQRSRIYAREDTALARRHRDELVAAKHAGTPVGPDGWPIDGAETTTNGTRHTFGSYLTEVYLPAHPDWSPKHRGNTESMGNIIAGLFTYPADDPRGTAGEPIWLDEITSDDADRMIRARRKLRRRGEPSTADVAISARTEDATWKVASAVFEHALARTPPAVNRNPMVGTGRRRPTREVRQRADEPDTAWSSAELDLVADTITKHFRALVLFRGRCAARPSEAAFIEPDDIDLDNLAVEFRGSFHVENSRRHNGGKRFRLGPLKHRDVGETRFAPIADHGPLLDALAEACAGAAPLNDKRCAEVLQLRAEASERGDEVEVARLDEQLAELHVVRVFRNEDGSPIDWSEFITDHWQPALDKTFADAPDDDAATLARKARRRATTFYELRHMAEAIWFNEYGVAVEDISRWVGTSVPTLLKHYTRRSARHEDRAWQKATARRESPRQAETSDIPDAVAHDAQIIDLARRRAQKRPRPATG